MMSTMFEASRRVWYLRTTTSGLRSLIACSAESTFGTPTREVAWMTWRWRLETSTTSSSTMPSVPSPTFVSADAKRAAAAAGEVERGRRAEAAGAQEQDLGVEQLLLALDADL